MAETTTQHPNSDGWRLTQVGFDPSTSAAWEGLFTLGSGHLHIRGAFEEPLADAPQDASYVRRPTDVTSEAVAVTTSRWGTYRPGVYGPHPHCGNELINLPHVIGVTLQVGDSTFGVASPDVTEHRRTLDMRTACIQRRAVWRPTLEHGETVELKVSFERFVSAADPRCCIQRITIAARDAVDVTIRGGIDTAVRTNGHDHFKGIELGPRGAAGVSASIETDGGDEISIESRFVGIPDEAETTLEPRRCARIVRATVTPCRPLIIEKRSAVCTSRDPEPATPVELLDGLEDRSYDELLAEHAAMWDERWASCDVEIEGDEASQRALRLSIYHLLRAHVTDDPRVAIDAKGYSGEAYWGRFFWDTEAFLLPFYLYTDPDRARTLVDYRVHSLPGARRNAERYGMVGAKYAWESDPAGDEQCPNWLYADHEVHITADVVYGIIHYAVATGNLEYPARDAASVILETTEYWASRLDLRDAEPMVRLLGVMGPDEYTPLCHDNAFTNGMVSFALQVGADIAEQLGAPEEDIESLRGMADALPILVHPGDEQLLLQCEGFHQLPDPDFDERWPDRDRPFGAQVGSEYLYRTRCLKQPDVLMLMMLFPGQFDDEDVRAAWEYYVPVTTHDSSLSAGVHAMIACRLGYEAAAWRFWRQALSTDTDVERGGAARGIHIANAGAIWQTAVFGFGGVMHAMAGGADALTINPALPGQWHRLTFPLRWRGVPVRIAITNDELRITNESDVHDLPVRFRGTITMLPPETTHEWSMHQE
jgi:kojibiose phosphorylase